MVLSKRQLAVEAGAGQASRVLARPREAGKIELAGALGAELVLAHAIEDLDVGLTCSNLAQASHRLGVLCGRLGVCTADLGLLQVDDTQLATCALLDHHVVHLGDALPQLTAGIVEAPDRRWRKSIDALAACPMDPSLDVM